MFMSSKGRGAHQYSDKERKSVNRSRENSLNVKIKIHKAIVVRG